YRTSTVFDQSLPEDACRFHHLTHDFCLPAFTPTFAWRARAASRRRSAVVWRHRTRARRGQTRRLVQDLRHDLLRVEVRLGDLPSRPAMPRVIGIDRLQRAGGLRQRCEPEQAFAVRQISARSGVLHNRRFAAGEVAQRSIADPGALKFHIRTLRATVLAARTLYIL